MSSFDELLAKARDAGRRGNDREATDLLIQAVELEPERPEAYRELGAAFQRAKDHASAQSAYEKCLELTPDDTKVMFALLAPLLDLGLPAEAFARLQRLLALSKAKLDRDDELFRTLEAVEREFGPETVGEDVIADLMPESPLVVKLGERLPVLEKLAERASEP